MFKRILIANRGEIAVRIIRACWELGIETVAIYSTEDKDSMHVKLADKAVCIGPTSAIDSYLNIEKIISIAVHYEVEAIHPGYGFLSENFEFCEKCLGYGIKFIGPLPEVISIMGNKVLAKKKASDLKIPTIPWTQGTVLDIEEAKDISDNIGYPICIKAVNGGGGKGIRVVNNELELEKIFYMCKDEAKKSFDSDELYIEKYITNPRHVEVQVLADNYGNVLILGERDCSIQRRNQKIIEESPATILDEVRIKQIRDFSKQIVLDCNYTNAGTIEFLVDEDGNVYFMEMNTRLQVEHAVTELVTNIDLVKEQIKIACGEPIDYKENNVNITGHAIECRINAENPNKNFCVSNGVIKNLNIPGGNGVRVDSALYTGLKISPSYDSNIAKVIVHGADRKECIRKMIRALSEFVIDGIETNIEFLLSILNNELFIENKHNTLLVNKLIKDKH